MEGPDPLDRDFALLPVWAVQGRHHHYPGHAGLLALAGQVVPHNPGYVLHGGRRLPVVLAGHAAEVGLLAHSPQPVALVLAVPLFVVIVL